MREIVAVKCVIDFRIAYYQLKSRHDIVGKYIEAALMLCKELSSS
jgi:hypothetical protein